MNSMDSGNNFVPATANDSSSENASFVAMTTVNQMMPPVALYSTEIPFVSQNFHFLLISLLRI